MLAAGVSFECVNSNVINKTTEITKRKCNYEWD